MTAKPDLLTWWLELDFSTPERQRTPYARDFLAELLDYPRDRVVVDGPRGGGFALLTEKGDPWVVGDLQKDDSLLLDSTKAEGLWAEKRKEVAGFTRYVLFLTPHRFQVREPTGRILLELDLTRETTDTLRKRLDFLTWERGKHEALWGLLVAGELPYSYLSLDEEGTRKLQEDLTASFAELSQATEKILKSLEVRYRERQGDLGEEAPEKKQPDAISALFEWHLPNFAEWYDGRPEGAFATPLLYETFAADTTAVLVSRVLFLRLLEDLGLAKRRLTNGGPKRWREFVELLITRPRTLIEEASPDLAGAYQEPFEENLFAWLLEAREGIDEVLQRLILRVNAYDFSTLSEEVLGDIYQNFLPPDKRKRLGEFYTPKEVVDLILRETALGHGDLYPEVLDPSCGSGSFLVRYLHHRVEDAKERGVHLDPERLAESIWGFDLNPFATYISFFQLLWGLLRLKRDHKPKVRTYNLNALLNDKGTASYAHFSEGKRARDEREWDYVVGNPPYIRAERAKYGEAIKGLYRELWGQNGDTGLLFLWRALKGNSRTERPWVKKGGRMGMVVSGGYASSEAAAKVWHLLWLGGEWSLRKLVWLEFAEKVWEANVIPMVLILERTPPKPEDEIELWVPSTWPKEVPEPHEVARIAYGDFFDPKANPQSSEDPLGYGEYLLPLIQGGDLPLLRKLYPGGENYVPLTEAMETQYTRHRKPQPFWWTYGIARAGAKVTEVPQGGRPSPVLAGGELAVAWSGKSVGYVDLEAVRSPSIWGREGKARTYLAVAKIVRAPFGVLVREEKPSVAVDTVIVGIPKPGLGEAVAAYLNSALARWYYLVRLRSGVIQGYYATIYPRTLEALPWPREPRKDLLEELSTLYRELEALAKESRYNPPGESLREAQKARERFTATLEAVDEVVFDLFGLTSDERAHVKARLASFPLNRLRPRYPWETSRTGSFKVYAGDRFRS
jgi:type I restriction-modification system DNA methylase subunit